MMRCTRYAVGISDIGTRQAWRTWDPSIVGFGIAARAYHGKITKQANANVRGGLVA